MNFLKITQIRERFLRIRNETRKQPNNEKFPENSGKGGVNFPSFHKEQSMAIKSISFQANPSSKSKVPLLNLNNGLKGLNSQENNLPQKNINISEIQNESQSVLEKNDVSVNSSLNRTVLVKNIDNETEEKERSKFSIRMPETKGKAVQNIFSKKPPVLEEVNPMGRPEMVSPNFSKKIAGKVFMPKLNLRGDKMETSKIGETPFDLKAMIYNAEQRQK